MRLAVFGDIHGNLPALEAVLDDMKSCGEFDLIWCLGDLAAVGGQPRECVQRISALRADLGEEKVKIIGGNTDRYLVTGERMPFAPPKDKSAFAAYRDNILSMGAIYQWNLMQLGWDDFDLLRGILGRELQHDVERFGRVIGFHAIPGNDESTALRPDSPDEEAADALLDRAGRLALCGHTHLAMERQVDGWRVINPGSVGLSFGNPGQAEWAVIKWTKGELIGDLRQVPYDVATTLQNWKAAGYPEMDWIRPRLSAL